MMHVLQALHPVTGLPVALKVDTEGRLILAPDSAITGNAAAEVDTAGDAIPSGRPITWTNRIDGQPETATITDGTDTWIYYWTYNGSGYCTYESGWVKQ